MDTAQDIPKLVGSLRRVIQTTLDSEVCYPLRDRIVCPTPAYESLVGLIEDLNAATDAQRCCIITLNYDIALDFALACKGHHADYCLSGASDGRTLPLLKLHGSMNWLRCDCGVIVVGQMKKLFEKGLRAARYTSDDKRSLPLPMALWLPKLAFKHCEGAMSSEPFIVPPTWNKTSYSHTLLKVWQQAAVQLSDAENIFVSGYSLNATDLFFRYLFALGSVGDRVMKRFWVFDPDPRVEGRFRELIGPDAERAFKFYPRSFAEAMRTIRAEAPVFPG